MQQTARTRLIRLAVESAMSHVRCAGAMESRRIVRPVDNGYLSLLPVKSSDVELDTRFVEYLLELSDGVTGRFVEVLRRTAH